MENEQIEQDSTVSLLNLEVVEQITVPFLVMEVDKDYYLRFVTAIAADTTSFSERVRKSKKEEEGNKEPIHIATVIDLSTKQKARLVVHSVLESTIVEARANDAYVDKIFKIRKVSKTQGKRYFTFNVTEMRVAASTSGNEQAPARPAAKR